ncbi:hypothetical protein PFICI_12698 [Pestalotiopsis fici W106-1]|uniref:Uncharacterized protein n=1 Tax=Pestalotiopsis fici (strain W106-1 / CGMCC3.15140) TaxID=1229662 RepID=W3WPP2_PESFW|nr:uncharacterized protein PFICI_12698 [Pestalotiopsis fici W106-1]ETS75754.1 hypothetical protein PFICI_12698 [Pestalotiopsis fici W106-1]
MPNETSQLISTTPNKKSHNVFQRCLHKSSRLLTGSYSTRKTREVDRPKPREHNEETEYADCSWYLNATQVKLDEAETVTGAQLVRNYRHMVWERSEDHTLSSGPSPDQGLEITALAEQLDALCLAVDDAVMSVLSHAGEEDRLRAVGLGLTAILPMVTTRPARPGLLRELHEKAGQRGQTEVTVGGNGTESQSVWVNTFYLRTYTAALAYVFHQCHELPAEYEAQLMDIAWKFWYDQVVRILLEEDL